ncbi:MAG: hypothetical protein QM648_06155 [Solirubrobacterales bacterium]
MYRHADEPFEPEDNNEREVPASGGRDFRALPLALAAAAVALAAESFAFFLLGWGMAPTSAGCGVGRVATISFAAVAISAAIYGLAAAAGSAALAESRAEVTRLKTFIIASAAIYIVFSIPMLAFTALLGSCFDL